MSTTAPSGIGCEPRARTTARTPANAATEPTKAQPATALPTPAVTNKVFALIFMAVLDAAKTVAEVSFCCDRRDFVRMTTKRKSKGAYMISAVAEMYDIHPQTLRLYEREGLLKPSRSEGNTRLYTDEDLERLEFILNLARDLGVNIAGIAIVLQMRERMEEMNRQMQGFVDYVRTEMLSRMQQQQQSPGLVPISRPVIVSKRHPATNERPAEAAEAVGRTRQRRI